jgi:5-amino-6-(5-phosphoribosylamino)uracil reductase
MPEYAPLVVVSASLDLDWSLPAFTSANTSTLVLTHARAGIPPEIREHVIVCGDESVDLRSGLEELRRRYGSRHVLCEGGPRLATAVLAEKLVDEVVLSIAPVLVPGAGPRVTERLEHRFGLRLREIYEDAGEVFLRYGVDSDG